MVSTANPNSGAHESSSPDDSTLRAAADIVALFSMGKGAHGGSTATTEEESTDVEQVTGKFYVLAV
jgi:hypothetical protein